jgi:hypothetical protein
MGVSKAQRASTAARRAKAIELRLSGVPYESIAEQLGYASRGAACADITRALEQSIAEQRTSAEVLREQELLRLDLLWQEAWRILKTEHYILHQGTIVDKDGKPLIDDGPLLQTMDRMLRIQERRSKFLGLDSASKHEVSISEIDDEIRRLTAELGSAAPTEADRAEDAEDEEG